MNPPREHGLDWSERQKKALTIACRYCEQREGQECVDRQGLVLGAQPAHWHREEDAAALALEQPMFMVGELPEPPDAAPPAKKGRSLVSNQRNTCDHCDARLLWAVTVNEKAMPLDAEPNPLRGNVLVTEQAGQFRASVVGKRSTAAAMRQAGQRMHLHHAVSCPYASRWHRK